MSESSLPVFTVDQLPAAGSTTLDGPEGKLILTGQLGDVMKESAQIALSYIQAHADELEQQLVAVPGEGDREPAHEAEVDVVAHLEAEVARVEVERLVLVEDGDALDADGGDVVGVHVDDASQRQGSGASPKPLSSAGEDGPLVAWSTPR